MADYQLKGSTDNWEQSLRTDNGCTARQPGCARGPVSGAVSGHASEWDPFVVARRALAVYAAYRIGRKRAPAAIVRATGLDDLPKLSKAVLSGMLQMALVVAATTAIGGLAGAAIGALFAGVGAAPGAAVGIDIGFNAGMAVLTWMGLAAIAIEVVRGIGEVTNLLQRGVVTAWEAEDAPNRQAEIDAAGELMAEAIGKLMLLVLLAIVARLTAAQAVASTERAAAASGELFAMLRRSRLGTEFAAWVEANAERLMRNPRLRPHRETQGRSAGGSQAQTPSSLAQSSPRPVQPKPANETGPSKSGTAPVQAFALDPALVRRIQALPKGQRPDPSSYMPPEVIESQLAQFEGGGTRFMLKSNLEKYGPAQKDGSSFIMTKAQADKLMQSAGGNARAMEDALGLPQGTLESGQLVRVDVPSPKQLGLRIPSGNEAGANELWIPGGKLPNGNLEAVVDLGNAPPSSISVTPLKFGGSP